MAAPGNIGHSGFQLGPRTPYGRPQGGGIRPGGGNAGFRLGPQPQMRPPLQTMQRPMMPPQMGGGMPQGGGGIAHPDVIRRIQQQGVGGGVLAGGIGRAIGGMMGAPMQKPPMPTPEQFQQKLQQIPQGGMFGSMIQKGMPQIMERYNQMYKPPPPQMQAPMPQQQGPPQGQPPPFSIPIRDNQPLQGQTPPFSTSDGMSDRGGWGGGMGRDNMRPYPNQGGGGLGPSNGGFQQMMQQLQQRQQGQPQMFDRTTF